ncbi:MAG: peptidase S16 [Burkholderiales bacterium]|nr:MAG: peptidase S16 [Burkholderiales bacterium]
MAPDIETPLFPLRSVLFPGDPLPLRIFEPRYLDMVQRCHARKLPFGVVTLSEGQDVRTREGGGFQREVFHDVGTLASIEQFDASQPGLIHIRTVGRQRFRLRSRRCLSHGLWVGEIDPLPDDADVAVPDDLRLAARQLQDVLASLSGRAAPEDLPVQPPYRWEDAGWLANRWAGLLPMSLDERHRLMALENPLLRLELVVDRLDALTAPGGPARP